jgi:hypothetical protein
MGDDAGLQARDRRRRGLDDRRRLSDRHDQRAEVTRLQPHGPQVPDVGRRRDVLRDRRDPQ